MSRIYQFTLAGLLIGSGIAYFPAESDTRNAIAAPVIEKATHQNYTEKMAGSDVTFDMIAVPGGTFTMGSPEGEAGRKADEGPQHEVTITRPFFLGGHEVTVGQFRAFVELTGHRTEAEASGRGAQGYDRPTGQWLSDPERTWRGPGFGAGTSTSTRASTPVACGS